MALRFEPSRFFLKGKVKFCIWAERTCYIGSKRKAINIYFADIPIGLLRTHFFPTACIFLFELLNSILFQSRLFCYSSIVYAHAINH